MTRHSTPSNSSSTLNSMRSCNGSRMRCCLGILPNHLGLHASCIIEQNENNSQGFTFGFCSRLGRPSIPDEALFLPFSFSAAFLAAAEAARGVSAAKPLTLVYVTPDSGSRACVGYPFRSD